MSVGKWPALESNPEAMNAYMRNIGVPEPVQMADIYGFDPDLAAMIPQPIYAIIVLFPEGDKIREARTAEYESLDAKADDVFFMQQRIRNACGTFALLHALANAGHVGSGPFADFLAAAKSTAPEDRSKLLFEHEAMSQAHQSAAEQGDTEEPEQLTTHFIAYVPVNGNLVEFDSGQAHAINRGKTTEDSFVADVGAQFKHLVELAGEDSNSFSAMALVGSSP